MSFEPRIRANLWKHRHRVGAKGVSLRETPLDVDETAAWWPGPVRQAARRTTTELRATAKSWDAKGHDLATPAPKDREQVASSEKR